MQYKQKHGGQALLNLRTTRSKIVDTKACFKFFRNTGSSPKSTSASNCGFPVISKGRYRQMLNDRFFITIPTSE